MRERKPDGCWSEQITLEEAKRFKLKHNLDILPSQPKLTELGRSDLANAISENGGFLKIRELLGENLFRVPVGYYDDACNIVSEWCFFMAEHNLETLPSSSKLNKLDYGWLVQATSQHYPGGFPGLRKDLGQNMLIAENGHWTKKTIFGESKKFLSDNNLEVLPGLNTLYQRYDRSDLASAISQYYPGRIFALRKDLGQNLLITENGYLAKEVILCEVKKFLSDNNLAVLPSGGKLRDEYGRSDLVRVIYKHYPGRFVALRKDLGQNLFRVENGHWTKEIIFDDAKKFLNDNNLDVLPSGGELRKNYGRSDLANVSSDHYPGGLTALRADLNSLNGIKSDKQKLEELLGGLE